MMLREKRQLMDTQSMANALDRVAEAIVSSGNLDLVLVGIHTGGVPLAKRLWERIIALRGTGPSLGMVDITLYRDDVFVGLPHPIIGETKIPGDTLNEKAVVLVDDVLFTGRTIRAALDALIDFGRPKWVKLAVLIDRGHRELPIHADFVGLEVETTRAQSVKVMLQEVDDVDQVLLFERTEG